MATAVRSVTGLEFPVPDTMDRHSNPDPHFGDDDIDVDLPTDGAINDDISLFDEEMDTELDMRPVQADQDDFMADHEDLIEENVDNDNPSPNPDAGHITRVDSEAVPSAPANLEEDLIDWASDEVDAGWSGEDHALDKNTNDSTVTATAKNEEGATNGNPAEAKSLLGDMPLSDHTHGLDGHYNDAEEHALNDAVNEATYHSEDNPHTDDVYQDLDQENALEHGDQDQNSVLSVPYAEGVSTEPDRTLYQENDLAPVTINYNEAELWLFKDHDYDDSGDYMIEDISLAYQPINSLLEACRDALRIDVSDDLELGFRLNSFHNIELYQEHSSCAFITLQELVNVYMRLQAQDEISDPESFYITLLFRPRVSSLLAELSNAAVSGIGMSGLNDAIHSGSTAFNANMSHYVTSQTHDEDSDEEEQGCEQAQSAGVDKAVAAIDGSGGHGQEHQSHSPQNYENSGLNQDSLEGQTLEAATSDRNVIDEGSTKKTVGNDAGLKQTVAQPPVNGRSSASATPSQPPPEFDEDFIDYSDDETEEPPLTGESQHHQPSSTSATVQGDEPPEAQSAILSNENAEGSQRAGYDGHEPTAEDTSANYDGFEGQKHESTYSGEYEEYQYDGDEDEQEYPVNDEYTGYSEEYAEGQEQQQEYAADDDTTNYPDGVDKTHIEITGEFHVDLDHDGTEDAGKVLVTDHDVAAFKPTSISNEDFDEITYSDDDDEGGAASQASVAGSGAADTVPASSIGLQSLTPQGQKRPYDEVGNDVANAVDSMGTGYCKCRGRYKKLIGLRCQATSSVNARRPLPHHFCSIIIRCACY